ncbi:uncharacterized protein PHALS_06909 [Plasmopara halstedii]|uniref:Uncharacterized protein n=1 Tax=Plasmopara halstedii TaxID=4781 RepID=A0A0P1B499_PLAHL|nr:uncharacterized protein PHALS_06909 [Plasmopara halstedii]CEG49129.1 hypothetical protein PHALS_06909 [Plasmopara halstedii]|eukprot:XP_024585498.1 hypothetical protein PHALS_06909 [Plasmopara halstedii]
MCLPGHLQIALTDNESIGGETCASTERRTCVLRMWPYNPLRVKLVGQWYQRPGLCKVLTASVASCIHIQYGFFLAVGNAWMHY